MAELTEAWAKLLFADIRFHSVPGKGDGSKSPGIIRAEKNASLGGGGRWSSLRWGGGPQQWD